MFVDGGFLSKDLKENICSRLTFFLLFSLDKQKNFTSNSCSCYCKKVAKTWPSQRFFIFCFFSQDGMFLSLCAFLLQIPKPFTLYKQKRCLFKQRSRKKPHTSLLFTMKSLFKKCGNNKIILSLLDNPSSLVNPLSWPKQNTSSHFESFYMNARISSI